MAKSNIILPEWTCCKHITHDFQMIPDGSLVVEIDTGGEDLLVLCPLCLGLVRDKILSSLFTDAVKSAVKDNIKGIRT